MYFGDKMKFKLLLVIFAVAVAGVYAQDIPPFTEDCRTDVYPPPSSETKVDTFVLNLDLAPEDRWTPLVKNKTGEMKAMIQDIIDLVGNFVKNETGVVDWINEIMAPIADTLPDPYQGEIKGIAKATGIPLGEVVLYNIFYEIFTFCTSIVAEDKSGKLYHARNLDFGLFLGWDTKTNQWELTERLRPLIINVDYQMKNQTVAKAVHFTGYTGVITGVKPGVITLTMNERFNINGGYLGLLQWILGDHTGHWVGFAIRDVLLDAQSYDAAKDYIVKSKLLAPAYFILGGSKSGQGAIITRDRESCAEVRSLNPKNGTWFLLETNYDPWTSPPFFDDRRTPGTKCMNKLGYDNAGLPGLFNVLSTKPNLNVLTTYTTLMQVDSGHMETYIRHCEQPCWPW
ncbi:acid ceramidase-like [Amphiura filiformis]|uniref:acid ceramidase-like n=1 Tax=Amphiura filiformis TaxID=82378 RepID=UPI003B224646